jgi:restriction endonuclease S subunit
LGVLKNIRVVNKYLYYALMADYSRNQINTFVVGGTIPTVSQEKVNNIKIAVPDEVLQMDIVRYLDSRCYEIDALIIKKESLIEEFEAYKKSLIYEYVTGKKEVE